MIPKIIHHTAPSDKNRWSQIWYECKKSWEGNFPGFNFMLWNDEDNRSLVKNDYPSFLELYDSFPHHIMRVDFIRFCILHKYGGIYSDMDIYCYKNFYDHLVEDVYIIESWPQWGETVQNSLMISSPNNDFWIECMEKSKEFYNSNIEIFKSCEELTYLKMVELCHKTGGPKLISSVVDSYTEEVYILPKELFNPIVEYQFNWLILNPELKSKTVDYYNDINSNENTVYTRHYLTGTWTENFITKPN